MQKRDYYQILEVERNATYEEVKQSYQKKVLVLHPDKLGTNRDQSHHEFQLIQQAWETLREVETRMKYDEKLKVASQKQDLPIFAEVDLDDMTFEESEHLYSWPCRCNGEGFKIHEYELEEGIDTVSCGTCSLLIKVLYQEET